MSDFNSSLPVRTQTNGDVVAQLVDGTITSQKLAINAAGQLALTSQGSATGGTAASFSELVGGIYNSAPPTLTNGQQSAFQLDVNGRLITTTSITPIADNAPATQNITAQDNSSTTTPGANGQSIITGSPDAGSTASFVLSTEATVRVQVSGTWTGTLQSEVSNDGGTTWYLLQLTQDSNPITGPSWTANFEAVGSVSGATNYRLRATAAWTGTATVKVIESLNIAMMYVGNPLRLVDASSSVEATIKAASTPAIATDTSLVVALSPNSPLPAGSNNIGSVNQGTSPWVTKDQADGPVTPGTVASFSQLIGAQFNSALPTLSSGQQSALQADSSGRLLVSQGGPASLANAWPVKPTDGTNSQSYTASGEAKVDITQPLPAGTNNIGKVSIQDSSGNPFSETNPLPVELAAAGSPVNDFKLASSIAASGTDNHDYTVTAGKTLHLTQLDSSASGKAKMEVQVETGVATGVFNSYFVQFNSTADPNMHVDLSAPILVAAGVRVRVIMTNRDVSSEDLYSTISGHEE